ncbi:hypothetical protein FA95DRAFT_1578783, partial [Auriscalpium vulgare]
ATAFESKRAAFIESVHALVEGTKEQKNDARGFLEKNVNIGRYQPTVHAEAGMMALACAFCSPDAAARTRSQVVVKDKDNVLTSIFKSHEAPVGVGKKCCYCCWALYTWLQKRKGFADVEPKMPVPDILLLGSHATIFPWYPPQFGIPIEFLRQLLKTLKDILAEAAEKKVGVGSSDELEFSEEFSRGLAKAAKAILEQALGQMK